MADFRPLFNMTLRGGKKITISGNEIAYVQNRGINLDSGLHDIVISQNHVHHTATPSVGGEGIEVWGSKKDGGNILIKGNRVYECAEDGIELVGVKNAQIIDNISHDNQGQGIDLYGGSDNNLLFNNVVFGNHKSGILITDSSNNNLFDNKIYRNSPYGVRFEKRHSPKGSKHNKLHGDSPWNNKQDIETDSIDNIIVHTGKYSAKLPLSSKEQIFQLETKKFTQVRYYFQKWWMRVEAVTEAGKVYHSRRRLPPNIQFDLLPQNSFLDYELLSFAPSPAPKKFLLDLRLRALDKPTMTKLVIPQPSAHHAQYQLIINGKVTDLKSVKDNSLIFNFLVTAKTQQVQVQKTIQ